MHGDHAVRTRMDTIGNMLEANHHGILIKHAMFYTTMDGTGQAPASKLGAAQIECRIWRKAPRS